MRVDEYFKRNNKSKYGNANMVFKTVFMLSVFFLPLSILISGVVTSTLMVFVLYVISGLGMAGIGMGVMHDAIHGSYSKNSKVNKYVGYTMNLIGANAEVWRIQHNVLHHTYTNIDEADDDINAPFFLRFSPSAKRYKMHRAQHLYIWIFYGLSTLSWITSKDFIRITRYRKLGLVKTDKQFKKTIRNIIFWKLIYFSYALILPLIMIQQPIWIILLAFISMHFVTGLTTSIIFQTAHVIPDTEFPLPDEKGMMENEWSVHQFATTSNFAPKSRILSWLIGGLNYQIEHHLFPNICHVHYRKLSAIVAETAAEYGVNYMVQKTFVAAVWQHIKMLRQLGRA